MLLVEWQRIFFYYSSSNMLLLLFQCPFTQILGHPILHLQEILILRTMSPIFLPKKASEYPFAHVSLAILHTPATDAIWFISHVSVTRLTDAQGANKAQLQVCLWWCFQKRLAFELVSKAGGPSQHGWASASPLWDYTEHKSGGRANWLSVGLGTSSSSALGHGCFWFSGLWTQTELNYWFSWSFSWQKAQTVGPLALYNCMKHFLQQISSFIHR